MVASFVKWRLINAGLRIIAVYLLITFILEVAMKIGTEMGKEIALLHHIQTYSEATLLTWYFLVSIKKFTGILISATALAWLIIIFSNSILFQGWDATNTNVLMLEAFVFAIMALVSLFRLLINEERAVWRQSLFWIWISQLLYGAGSFFFWALVGIIYHDYPDLYRPLATAHFLLSILAISIIAAVFFVIRPKKIKLA